MLTGGLTLVGPYRFTSVTLKSLERRIDGLFEPVGHAGPVHLVEFCGQSVPGAWYNLLAKLGLYGERNPGLDLLGIGVFLSRRHIPPWPSGAARSPALIRVVALDEVLPGLLAREPDDSYVITLAPLVLSDAADLIRRAPALWQAVQQAPLPDDDRALLSQVLAFWFFERLRNCWGRRPTADRGRSAGRRQRIGDPGPGRGGGVAGGAWAHDSDGDHARTLGPLPSSERRNPMESVTVQPPSPFGRGVGGEGKPERLVSAPSPQPSPPQGRGG